MSSFASARRERCPPESVGDVLLPRFAAEADAEERRLEPVPPRVAAGELEVVLDGLVLRAASSPARRPVCSAISCSMLAQPVGELVQLGERQLGLVDDGVGRVERRVLREVADLHATWRPRRCRSSGSTSPVRTLNSVVLPLPLAPMKPTRSPRSMLRFSPSNRTRWPKFFSMLVRVATGTTAHHRAGGKANQRGPARAVCWSAPRTEGAPRP